MKDFLITSLIASVALTAVINLLPDLFPKTTKKAERKIIEQVQKQHNNRVNQTTSKVRIFFPWKIMLIGSIGLTIAVNLIGYLSR